MYATELIADRAFGPEALKVIGQAFEDAWAEIAGNFGEGQEETAVARTALARAVLALATNDSRDAEALKKAALLTMALNYREGAAWRGNASPYARQRLARH